MQPWNKVIERIAKELHSGKLKPSDLDQELVQKTYETLNKGVSEGYGAKYHQYNAQNSTTVQKIQQNIYQFSAAKTYQQLAEYNGYLVDENGKERSFNDFKKLVLEKHPKYNQNYLQAEYQTAKASGQMAAKWEGFQRNKERYPYLKYKTVGDDHVRDDHRTLDGFMAHIDDKIWDRIYPPNDWRCRCFIVQTNQKPKNDTQPDLSFMKPEFSLNVGKTGVVFNDKAHPYYIIPKNDEKRMKLAFESMKTRLAYGKANYTAKNGSKLYEHPFADKNPSERVRNFEVAKEMVNKLNRTIKITPKVDGRVILNKKNPEYLIDGKISDRKAPKGKNLKNIFKKSASQGVKIMVIDLIDCVETFDIMKPIVTNKLNTEGIFPKLKEIILVSKDREKIESIKRDVF